VKTVFVAPDGIFHKINLATLQLPNGQFLSEKHQFTTVQNLSSLLFSPQKSTENEATACLFGNPRFDFKLPNIAKTSTEIGMRSLILEDYLTDSTAQLQPLPATESEVFELSNLLKTNNFRVQTWTDTAATEVNLRKIARPKVLHIATHGHFLKSPKREKLLFNEAETSDNPMLRSMLFFTGATNTLRAESLPESVGDGVFTAFEAENLNLKGTELVVLSACETGLGVIENGEGVFGLQRAFRTAGARFVLISLWEVEDKQTRIFMEDFYKNWLSEKLEIPAAFQKTQLKMQKNGVPAQFWGAFVLLGN
jgi:CHAT domain-containing protein